MWRASLFMGEDCVLNINPYGGSSTLSPGYYPLIYFSTLSGTDNSFYWSATGQPSYSFVISYGTGPVATTSSRRRAGHHRLRLVGLVFE